ncbi:Na+/H+ antiporter subunit E [Candidatus Nitronereus thalassa]|uniref:Na+/H+ antiporter subunit E n=1 Tax=Candidatus Nitronereus thalassa TaxID=3020898 RepID=A0ABU3KA92_9BACT|nr:Na+/H+ antiporter subunit E [Candidatus Nitronereus thalassa]MDT7043379.1 Na+/H+ antiporter subunit E [Candidatus Nitronereus thalassa]
MRPISSQFLFLKTLALFVVWIMLSGSFDPIHLGLGFALSFLVAWLNSGHSPFVPRFRLWGKILWYLPWLFIRIVQSSLHVTRLILDPRLPIHPRLIQYTSTLREPPAVVLLGNSITLTPGTITAEVNGNVLLVHALDELSAQDVTSGRIESKIAEVFKEEVGRS